MVQRVLIVDLPGGDGGLLRSGGARLDPVESLGRAGGRGESPTGRRCSTQNQATNQEMLRQLQAMAKPAAAVEGRRLDPGEVPVDRWRSPTGRRPWGTRSSSGEATVGPRRTRSIHRRSDAERAWPISGSSSRETGNSPSGPGPWNATGGLNVIPGSSIVKEIVCPKSLRIGGQVRVRVDWPGPLADKDLVAVASFRAGGSDVSTPPRVEHCELLPEGGHR